MYTDIASVLYNSKRYFECLAYLKEALNIYIAMKGDESLSVAKRMYKIGTIYQKLG